METPDLFQSCFPLRAGRAHEVCGAGARGFAAILGGMRGENVLWLVENRRRERMNPLGLGRFCDPRRVLLAGAGGHVEMLAMAEEALRSGAVGTVVAETRAPLDLTAGRRLQLAAEAGGALGVFLIAEGMGSNAAETRWLCEPQFDPGDSTCWRWRLIKNKSGTLGSWVVRWDEQARRIAVVSATGE